MDLGLLWLTSPQIAHSNDHQAQLSGGFGAPISLVRQWLPDETAAELSKADDQLPLELRTMELLRAGLLGEANELMMNAAWRKRWSASLRQQLSLWCQQQDSRNLVFPAHWTRRDKRFARTSIEQWQQLCPAIARPPWTGPFTVSVNEQHWRLFAPIVRCSEAELLPEQLVALSLHLLQAPRIAGTELSINKLPTTDPSDKTLSNNKQTTTWPAWWRVGLTSVLIDYSKGQPPLPSSCWRQRRSAGEAALRALLSADQPDPQLARALTTALVTSRRRGALAHFWELLSIGMPSEQAIKQAYNLRLLDLINHR